MKQFCVRTIKTIVTLFSAASVPGDLTKSRTWNDQYCTVNNSNFNLYAAALYFFALQSLSLPWVLREMHGWSSRATILSMGILFLTGSAMSAVGGNLLFVSWGRAILPGVGLGFAAAYVPLYISEIAKYNCRGTVNMICFQMMIPIGVLVANLVNYVTNDIKGGWGWRVGIGLAAIPATIISFVSFWLPNTPSYMIERGESEEAKRMLQRIRGSDDVNKEFDDLLAANEAVKILTIHIFERKHRPYLVMAIVFPIFQQFTRINALTIWAPLLFRAIGFGSDEALKFAVVIGGVYVAATFLAIIFANRLRRRFLLIVGGVQMFVCQVIIGNLIRSQIETTTAGVAYISAEYADLVLVAFICIFVSSVMWLWGPLGWLVPTEVYPLEIRSEGHGINVVLNMLFTWIMSMVFEIKLCHYKFLLFYIFAFFALTMTLLVIFFLPETKGIPIEEMSKVWKQHWFWGRYVIDPSDQDVIVPIDHDFNQSQTDSEKKPPLPFVAVV